MNDFVHKYEKDKSGDEDGGDDHFVDVDLELLLELVEVFLRSLASPHPAGWGVGKPAASKNSEERLTFGKKPILAKCKEKTLVKAATKFVNLWAVARAHSMEVVR